MKLRQYSLGILTLLNPNLYTVLSFANPLNFFDWGSCLLHQTLHQPPSSILTAQRFLFFTIHKEQRTKNKEQRTKNKERWSTAFITQRSLRASLYNYIVQSIFKLDPYLHPRLLQPSHLQFTSSHVLQSHSSYRKRSGRHSLR